jgi:ribosome biogenesis GTPase
VTHDVEDDRLSSSPAGLGRRPELDAELRALGDPELTPARVLAQHRGYWLVARSDDDSTQELVQARGRVHDVAGGLGGPVTGDWVALDAGGAIAAVLERHGAVVRQAAGKASGGQVLAANVDLALVIEPLPEPNERRVERLVALAAGGGVTAAIVLSKADLDLGADHRALELARRVGVLDGVALSVRDGNGVAVLRGLLEPDATAVLLGPSGAGKSTLVNTLLGEDRQATAAVRADGRGRHTTVTRELLRLPWGAWLIDTPGIREAGVWEGTGDAFADIEALAADCRFSDCMHDSEPGCAVRDAVDPERLASWRKLTLEQAAIDERRRTRGFR